MELTEVAELEKERKTYANLKVEERFMESNERSYLYQLFCKEM